MMKRKRIALYGGIFIGMLAALLFITRNRKVQELPKAISHLHLIEEVNGEEARKQVDELHRKEVAPADNIIGKYQSMDGNAVLYLSAYSNPKEADEQFEKMVIRIRDDNGVFTHFRETNVEGVRVILCLGMGQAHYFFVSGGNLYWFTVDIPIAQASVKELVRLTNATN
jgi:hypothetical protein